MTIPTQTFDQFVAGLTSGWAAAVGVSPVFTDGDPLLAAFQAESNQLMFLQAIAQAILKMTRAATSTGADLDTWMADFQFPRLPATFAEGPETFSTINPVPGPVHIPAATLSGGVYSGGTQVQTIGGGIVYQVIPDLTQPTYDVASNSYIMAIGQSSLQATIQALVKGSGSNVSVGQVRQIASSLPGINFATNPNTITNGIDPETDAAFRKRFIDYLNSLAKATLSAILNAVNNTQQGLQVEPLENTLPNGATQAGTFTIVVDDGSGHPSSGLLAAIYANVFAVRAFSVQPFVIGPTVITVPVVITVRGSTTGVVTAIQNVLDALIPGATAFVSAVEQAALSAGATAVRPGTLINGVNVDYVPGATQAVKAGSVTVNTY